MPDQNEAGPRVGAREPGEGSSGVQAEAGAIVASKPKTRKRSCRLRWLAGQRAEYATVRRLEQPERGLWWASRIGDMPAHNVEHCPCYGCLIFRDELRKRGLTVREAML